LTRSGLPSKDKKAVDSSGHDVLPVYAHIHFDADGTSAIKSFQVNTHETPTRVNLKQSAILLTRPQKSDNNDVDNEIEKSDTPGVQVYQKNGKSVKTFSSNNFGGSILLPDIENNWEIETSSSGDHSIVQSINGWQNVSLRSRIYQDAHSKLYLTFNMKLVQEKDGSDTQILQKFSAATTIQEAIALLGEDYIQKDFNHKHISQQLFEQEKTVCQDCRTLKALVEDYRDFMAGSKSASVPATIAFLKLLERVRIAGPGTSKEDLTILLKKLDKEKKRNVLSSVLDVLAASRTESAVTAAFEFLHFSKNQDLDITERFLQSLAASCVTAAAMSSSSSSHVENDIAGHRFIVDELYRLVSREGEWESQKLRWTAFLTLASVSKSYTSRIKAFNSSKKASDLQVASSVVQLIVKELKSCPQENVDCKLALLHSLGNSGNLIDSLSVLEEYALDVKGKRESIAAMKAVRECLEDPSNQPLTNSSLIQRLRILSLKIVYDSNHESTSRIIAAEIIAKHLSDSVLSGQLLKAVPEFGKFS